MTRFQRKEDEAAESQGLDSGVSLSSVPTVTQPSASVSRRKVRDGRKALGRWAVGGALLAAVGVAIVALPHQTLNAELTAARQEGLVTSAAEVRAAATAPSGTNAADVYRDRVALFRARQVLFREVAPDVSRVLEGTATDAEKRLTRQRLARLTHDLDGFDQAAKFSRLDFQRHWEDGYGVLLPELASLRAYGRMLCADAWLRAEAGDAVGAQRRLLAAARLSAHLRQEPVLISSAVAFDLADGVLKTLEFHPSLQSQPVEQALGPAPNLRRMFAYELQGGLAIMDPATYRRVITDFGVRNSGAKGVTLDFIEPFRTVSRIDYVRAWREAYRRLPHDAHDYQGAIPALRLADSALHDHFPQIGEVFLKLDGGYGGIALRADVFEKRRERLQTANASRRASI